MADRPLPLPRETMTTAIERLKQTPWAAKLLDDPDWIPARTASRTPKSSTEDSFFAETLGTDRTIRSLLSLRPKKLEAEEPVITEVRTVMELGNGLNGHPLIAHGGFVATMLDEVCGVLITLNLELKNQLRSHAPGEAQFNLFTVYLNTQYKRPVPTPSIVLCTTKFERVVGGNKYYVRATVEDGNGTVYSVGESLFVVPKSRL